MYDLTNIIEQRKGFKVMGKYGIPYLDDYLLGILQEDFVLIGAETGQGKSELAYDIAFLNSEDLNVHLFALEADIHEPYYRKLYKLIAQEYYSDPNREYIKMNYRNYITNKIDVSKYEELVKDQLDGKYEKLNVHYREGQFNINTLTRKIAEIKDTCDLIIIDHVDYFDIDHTDNENRAMTEIMKQLRNINQVYRIPVIAISHLRKKYNKRQIIPSIDDFMGSSNKAKQVKTVIVLAKDYENEDYRNGLYGTFIHVAKSRVGGACSLAGRLTYDIKKSKYLDQYDLCKVRCFGEKVENIQEDKYPDWTKRREVYF